MLGRSPARNRARNDSATTSKGSRSTVGSLMVRSSDVSPGKAARISLSRSSARVYRLLAADLSSPRAAAASPLVICS